MLVALRILQSEFQEGAKSLGLAPVRANDDTLTLLIPVDPFKSHIEEFQVALHHRIGERPDLLVASLRFDAGRPSQLRITPIEVKARGDVLSQADRQAALSQATIFSRFLADVFARSRENRLWGMGWRSLIASWLDYGFRVYGQLDGSIRQDEWTGLHSMTVTALMNGDLKVQIDKPGRLIIIDGSNSSGPLDIDGDGIRETMAISHPDAYRIVVSDGEEVLPAIRSTLGNWGLLPEMPTIDSSPDVEASVSGNGGPFQREDPAREEGPTEILMPVETVGERIAAGVPHAAGGALPVPSGLRFRVGTALDAFQKNDLYFYPGNTELNQLNVGIVGDLGTGKTQLIQALLYQLRNDPNANRSSKPKVLIFDYKKDYSKKHFVEATGARVISPFHIPLNVFQSHGKAGTPNMWLERSKFFSDILDKIYSGIGPLQRQRIKQAVRDAYQRALASGQDSPTIYDVFDAYSGLCGGQVDSPFSIISDIVDGEYFVRDPRKVVSFADFLDGIVVVDLAAVGQDDRTKNMLVVVFLNMFYEHMLTIEKKPFLGQNPRLRFVDTMLLVDEADNIMSYEFDVLKRILLQGREFGVGVVLASQYLSHFKTRHENYLEPLLTWFIHKVPTITVKELESIGLTRVDTGVVERIKALACHECLYKTLDVPGEFMRATPFYEILASSVATDTKA
jgi:DNA phosphorothioation-dependent restriction protein DptH